MHNLIRYYNQNRRKVWLVIVIIIASYSLIRLLNYFTIINNEKRQQSTGNVQAEKSTNSYEKNSTYTTNKSAVSGITVQSGKLEQVQKLLDSFIDNCNNRNLEEAYSLLTDECKEEVYPSLDAFKENYYNNMFEGKTKIYSFQNWHDNTYYITLMEDILSTGKINVSDNEKHDYITVVGDKLNIRSFIGNYEMGKENTDKGITIKIRNKQTFIDYEIYSLNIKNDSDKTICLTQGEDSNDIYIQDKNNVKYGVVNNEIINSQMYIKPGTSRNLSFKFYSSYVSDKKIQRLVFKKLNLDTEEVEQGNIYEYKINF